jgi:hypothetical protein
VRLAIVLIVTFMIGCGEKPREVIEVPPLPPLDHYREAIKYIEEGSEGSYALAIAHLEQCGFEHPACAYGLGVIHHRGYGTEVSLARALSWFEIAAVEGYLPAINDIAWLLVTVDDDQWYNPTEALEWADFMRQSPGHLRSIEWDTVAAVFAANRLIEEAVNTQYLALELAHEEGQSDEIINEMMARLQLYLSGKCYRENVDCKPSGYVGPATRL